MKYLLVALAVGLPLLITAQSFPCMAQSSLPVVRSGLVPAGPDEHARLSVINASSVSSGAPLRVNLRIQVWSDTADRHLIAHSLLDTISSGTVTLVPGQGVSLVYANDACDKRGDCNSVSAIVEFPDGPDVRATPTFQLIDARKGRVLLTVLHDTSPP